MIRYLLTSTKYDLKDIADLSNAPIKSICSIYFGKKMPLNSVSELCLVKTYHCILFQEQLHELLMHRAMTAKWCRKAIPQFLEMIDAFKKSTFKSLVALGRTFCQWKDEIARMWRFRKSNGITEGFHRKMKLIQRRAYGFRNLSQWGQTRLSQWGQPRMALS